MVLMILSERLTNVRPINEAKEVEDSDRRHDKPINLPPQLCFSFGVECGRVLVRIAGLRSELVDIPKMWQ